jgi:glycosyltransferase involved in cell wall biosynthesis
LEAVGRYLATSDVGLQPDPKNPRTDLATASKTMEYMAYGLPVVAFDVHETRVSAGEAAMYAEGNDPAALGDLVVALLDDPDRRAAMGRLGRRRVESELAWEHQKAKYVTVFDRLCGAQAG